MEEKYRGALQVRISLPLPSVEWCWHSILRLLTEISDSVSAAVTKRANRSTARNALSYMRDPGRIDGMKKKLDAVLSKFQVCSYTPITTIHVRWDGDIKLQTNIAIGHTLALVVKYDTTILSKLDSMETQLFHIGAECTLWVYIVLSDDKNV